MLQFDWSMYVTCECIIRESGIMIYSSPCIQFSENVARHISKNTLPQETGHQAHYGVLQEVQATRLHLEVSGALPECTKHEGLWEINLVASPTRGADKLHKPAKESTCQVRDWRIIYLFYLFIYLFQT